MLKTRSVGTAVFVFHCSINKRAIIIDLGQLRKLYVTTSVDHFRFCVISTDPEMRSVFRIVEKTAASKIKHEPCDPKHQQHFTWEMCYQYSI